MGLIYNLLVLYVKKTLFSFSNDAFTKHCLSMGHSLFSTVSRLLTTLRKKHFENIVGQKC